MFGLDLVTDAQVRVQWPTLRTTGLTFAYVMATSGLSVVPSFQPSWRAMRDAGIRRGAWHSLRGDESVTEQAIMFLKTVELQRGDLPPALDIEPIENRSPSVQLEAIKTWLSVVESELEARHGTKMRPLIRTSTRAWAIRQAPSFENYPLWIVDTSRFDHPALPNAWETDDWTLHQYSTATRGVPGTGIPVQLDRFNPCKRGDKGRRVSEIKNLMRRVRFGFGVSDNAMFDEYTRRAIMQFQASRNLIEDGIVGPATYAELCWP